MISGSLKTLLNKIGIRM